jgi:cell division protein FtsW
MKIAKYIRGDRVIWMVIILLSITSLLSVYSSSQALAFSGSSNRTFYLLIKQMFILSFGVCTIIVTHLIPYKIYSRLSQLMLFIVLPLLLLTLIFGRGNADANRWLEMPGGFTIQTSDFAKIILVIFTARILSLKQEKLGNIKEAYIPIIIATSLVCGLILPANFSTAALLFATIFLLMFIGRIPVKFLLLTVAGGLVAFSLFLVLASALNLNSRQGTWKSRMDSFLHASEEGVNNYQVDRAKVAIVNGGIFGKGPGNSMQKEKLPQANSDFIYAIIVEEYGLFGGVVVLFLYMWLLFRTALIVKRSNRTFPAFAAMGLAMLIVFQAMVNMAVAVNLAPVTGQTLPFISSGGSSVLFTSIALGVILSASWGIEEELKKQEEDKAKHEE